jgi:hypothetical protein
MTREIDGFTVGPHTTNTIVVERIAEPHHEYVFGVTPEGVELHVTAPDPDATNPTSEDARRFVNQATEAAKKYRDQLSAAAE